MKTILLLILFYCIICNFANAEVKEVTISGSIDFDMIYRNNYEDYDNDIKDQAAYCDLELNIYIRGKLSENISFEIELEEGVGYRGLDADNVDLNIDEVFFVAKEFIWEPITLKMGKMSHAYWMRNSLMDSQRRYKFWLIGAYDPTGLVLNYKKDKWDIDLYWMKVSDNSKLGENSRSRFANSETGNSSDIDFYGLTATYSVSENTRLRGMLVQWNDNVKNSSELDIYGNDQKADRHCTVAVLGFNSLLLNKSLELYGEFAYQWGTQDEKTDLDIDAFAGYVGAEYAIDYKYNPYIGFELMYFEGDGDDHAQWQNLDSLYSIALMFENQNQNHNKWEHGGYARASVLGGLNKIGFNDDMKVDFILSYFWDTDDSVGSEDQIGFEADIIWTWMYSENLSFELGLGYFFVDDDYSENKYGNGAEDDDAFLVVWNTTLKF